MTLFEKIINRDIPADIVYEDDEIIAFNDIAPQAPVHILIIPKKPITRLAETQSDDHAVLGKLLLVSKQIAATAGVLESGYRLVINNGKDAGEAVPHLHVHLLGQRTLQWPPG